ncbi:hypothetical protein BDFG_07440 [Blastomyces dermatitidis ATCC 26199]|nr:hypothetical protein BDFG_07440 [Blastomyces dermatitidis ATCC 26199]
MPMPPNSKRLLAIHPKVFRQPQRAVTTSLTTSLPSTFITAMNDRIDDMEHFKSIGKCLGNALDYMRRNTQRPRRHHQGSSHLSKMLEDAKSEVQ